MPATLINRVHATLGDTEHPYLTGAWTPNFEEYDATDLEVIGEIPTEIDGVYVRNTENPVHAPIGIYHPFDGDGMLHSVGFGEGDWGWKSGAERWCDPVDPDVSALGGEDRRSKELIRIAVVQFAQIDRIPRKQG